MADRLVALVTGGSRGIGAATAVEFASQGYDVAIVARSESSLAEVSTQVKATGRRVVSLAGDLGDLGFVGQIVGRVVGELGRVDALVNNAAWRELVTMRTISIESWEKTLRVCLTSPAFLARDAAADMEKRRCGAIINISSIQSQRVSGYAPAYMAAKGGLDSLTYDLAALYGPMGVRVVGVCPGAIDTEMSGDTTTPDGQSVDAQAKAYSHDMIPLRRWGTSEEIARAIVWLAGPSASYVTGTTLAIDGGWTHHLSPYSLKKLVFPREFP